MKRKKDKQDIILPVTEPTYISELEKASLKLQELTEQMKEKAAQTYAISDELSARCRDMEKQRRKRRFVPTAPANTTIDLHESESSHFAKGMNWYKLLLVCFIGSFAGVVVD